MKIKDFQLPTYLIKREFNLSPVEQEEILNTSVRVLPTNEPDSVINRGNEIVLLNPSSPTRFSFNLLYTVLNKTMESEFDKDKLALVLFELCRNYFYTDINPVEPSDQPPVLVSYSKVKVPSLILREIIEPITGRISFPKLFYIKCPFTDSCRIIENYTQLSKMYGLTTQNVGFTGDYPLILVNTAVHNLAAQHAHIVYNTLKICFGPEKTQQILQNVLLNKDVVYHRILTIHRILDGTVENITSFMKYLKTHVEFNEDLYKESLDIETQTVEADYYYGNLVKQSSDGYMNSRINRQWTEVSMMIGLIEKQLEPSRGSMWPASENLAPIEDEKRKRILEYAKKHKKKPWEVNFEQLLEVSRDWYNTNAIQPGKLYEELLKDNRAWKV